MWIKVDLSISRMENPLPTITNGFSLVLVSYDSESGCSERLEICRSQLLS
jgi:hypothetical protein